MAACIHSLKLDRGLASPPPPVCALGGASLIGYHLRELHGSFVADPCPHLYLSWMRHQQARRLAALLGVVSFA